MGIETLLRKVDKFIMGKNLKPFVVGVPLVFSGLGMYYTIDYASKGEYGKATIAGLCGIINSYYAGYQSRNLNAHLRP
ncbi:hypothetical protein HYX14_01195 [Candidatus Woesearchaeota archaeon]|nr:hypothetical protein [Candidatus Woesearchaeota archaeon]